MAQPGQAPAGLAPFQWACAAASLALAALMGAFLVRPEWSAPGAKLAWVSTWYGIPGFAPSLAVVLHLLLAAHVALFAALAAASFAIGKAWGRHPVHGRLRVVAACALLLCTLNALTILGDFAVNLIHRNEVAALFGPQFEAPLFTPLVLLGLAAAMPLPWVLRLWMHASTPLEPTRPAPRPHSWICPHCTRTYATDVPLRIKWRCPQCTH